MERCQKCHQQSLKSKNTTLECYHTFCPACTNALPFPVVCPICKVSGASPLQCCRCNGIPANLKAISLKCRHTVCKGCADEIIINAALTCPSCNVRTFFENEPKQKDDGDDDGPSLLRRKQSGTYCPQCGASFMKKKARQVNLKCQHLICESCVLERMIDGALSCPACNKRTFFEPVHSAPAPLDDEDAEPVLRRKQTGTYCPNCGRSFLGKKAHTLRCSHLVCDQCMNDLCVDGSLPCPTCNMRTFYEKKPTAQAPKEEEPGLQRKQTGTYCPQCGRNYMSKDMKQVGLKCSHYVCEKCADELCVEGMLTCPTCNKRTFYQHVPVKAQGAPASPPDDSFSNRMRRLQSGTYCPLCGISFMSRGVTQMSLNCQHHLCQNCVSALVHMNSVQCPVCSATTPLSQQGGVAPQAVYYPQAVSPPQGARTAPYR